MANINSLKQGWGGVAMAVLVGVVAVFIREMSGTPVLDPLFIALAIGIILRSFLKFSDNHIAGLKITPMLLIPIGVILYGAVNLDFVKITAVEPMIIFIIVFAFLGNAALIFFLSDLLGIKPKIASLITAGSAICGASAIAITSDAVEAEPDDVSNSLIPVFISALFGLFIFLPFLAIIFKITGIDYSIMSGALLQFTGFVREAVVNAPFAGSGTSDLMSLALSVKAVRFIGLLILIPIFASFVKRKFYIPWYLIAFLAAGILFSYTPSLAKALNPILEPILTYLWSIAMGAIGLNANLKILFSKEGAKTLAISLISFIVTTGIFLGMYLPLREILF